MKWIYAGRRAWLRLRILAALPRRMNFLYKAGFTPETAVRIIRMLHRRDLTCGHVHDIRHLQPVRTGTVTLELESGDLSQEKVADAIRRADLRDMPVSPEALIALLNQVDFTTLYREALSDLYNGEGKKN